MPDGELNVRMAVFVAEFAKDGNGTRAAIAARYSEKTAAAQASRLLRNVKVRAALDALSAEVDEETRITVARIRQELLDALERAKGARERPGDDGRPVKRYDGAQVSRLLELLMKHLRMMPTGAEAAPAHQETKVTITIIEEKAT